MFGHTESDVVFTVNNYGWMVYEIWHTFGNLARGGTTVIFDGDHLEEGILWKLVAKYRITMLSTHPSFIKDIHGHEASKGRLDHLSLRLILFAGEAYPPELQNWLSEKLPNAVISNSWGNSEFGSYSASNLLN